MGSLDIGVVSFGILKSILSIIWNFVRVVELFFVSVMLCLHSNSLGWDDSSAEYVVALCRFLF